MHVFLCLPWMDSKGMLLKHCIDKVPFYLQCIKKLIKICVLFTACYISNGKY